MTIDMDRRALLAAPAVLSVFTASGACAQLGGAPASAHSRTLVAYFSRSGNTRVIAGTIQRALSADLFEIEPGRPYPADYEQTVEQARLERDRSYEPPLTARVQDIRSYDMIFLGFPVWGETAPPVIRSFLRAHDLSGKTLRPFVTHGGYGLGESFSVIAAHAPAARIETAFSMEADQERRTLTRVNAWLADSGLR